MSIEAKRGCGYRKAGGIYVIGDLSGAIPAEYLPFCIDYPFSRGMTWAQSERLFATCLDETAGGYRAFGRLGLMWVGEQHYKTPGDFTTEAIEMGVSRRVAFLPKDLKVGDPIAAAHLRAVRTWNDPMCCPEALVPNVPVSMHCLRCRYVIEARAIANTFKMIARNGVARPNEALEVGRGENPDGIAGVFCLFRMTKVEVVLPEGVAQDLEIVKRCTERGVEIVAVPDHDPDHVPAGWRLPSFLRDAEPEGEQGELLGDSPALAASEG